MDDLPTKIEFDPSQIQVVDEEGNSVSIPDYDSFMQFLMLSSIAHQAVQIRKYFDDRTPNGYTQSMTVVATGRRLRVGFPWDAQSAVFINRGPDPVYIWINTIQRAPHIIRNVNEIYNVDFEVHKLKRFWHQCDPGNTASVEVTALD